MYSSGCSVFTILEAEMVKVTDLLIGRFMKEPLEASHIFEWRTFCLRGKKDPGVFWDDVMMQSKFGIKE